VPLAAPAAALGSLSADRLVLWAPVTTVLAVCLVLTHQPLPIAAQRRPRAASVQGDCRSPDTRSDDRGA
jgi:hypothetical protein